MPTRQKVAVSVIYEDKNFLAVNKPAGLLVHGVSRGRTSSGAPRAAGDAYSLADWLRERYPETASVGDDPNMRPGMVHRLDRETSGVLLVARNQKTFEYLKTLFQKREAEKTYLALAWGRFKKRAGIIDTPIGIRSGTVKRSIYAERMVKEAVTKYRVVREIEREGAALSLVRVFPKTGRTHQIRVHLASIGHPVAGDRLYGMNRFKTQDSGFTKRLMLHALALEFTAPGGERMRIEADPPAEFRQFL